MCRRSEHDPYAPAGSKPARTNFKTARSLVEALRDRFRPRPAEGGVGGNRSFPG
jgi:hypothetical protein